MNTRLLIVRAYVLCLGLAGISGILLAFYTKSVSPSTHGSFYEPYGIAAAGLGGCSRRGGEGSIAGILRGTALRNHAPPASPAFTAAWFSGPVRLYRASSSRPASRSVK